MSQNALVLPTTGTVSGLQMTQATNNALDTLNTLASGASAPSSPEAGQLWHDTTNNIIKMRSADNTTWIALLNISESAYTANPSTLEGNFGYVNRLINSGFQIDQVNEGASYTIPVNNTYTYTADQWSATCLSSTAAGVTAQRVTDAPAGFSNSLKLTVGTGASSVGTNDFLFVWQPIEANNVSDLNFGTTNAGYVSLSFWVKASAAGTYSVALQNATNARACVNKFTVTSAGSWQFVTIAGIPCDQSGTWASGNNAGLLLYFTIAVGSGFQTSTFNAWQTGAFYGASTQSNTILTTSGATFQLAGVMLNAGVFALPYERRSIQQELTACARYYTKSFPQGTAVAQNAGTTGAAGCVSQSSSSGFGNSVTLPVPMRTSPTLITYNPSAANSNWRDITTGADRTFSGGTGSEKLIYLYSSGGVANAENRIHFTANARM